MNILNAQVRVVDVMELNTELDPLGNPKGFQQGMENFRQSWCFNVIAHLIAVDYFYPVLLKRIK